MALKIDFETAAYTRAHGTAPKGRGRWGFAELDGGREGPAMMAPGTMTLTEAKKWFRDTLTAEAVTGHFTVRVLP